MFSTLSAREQDAIINLYITLFGRAPEVSGAEYWAEKISKLPSELTAEQKINHISEQFLQDAYVFPASGFTSDMSQEDFIKKMYLNALGRGENAISALGRKTAPNREEIDFWLDELAAGRVTHSGFALRIVADSKLFGEGGTASPTDIEKYKFISNFNDNRLKVAREFVKTENSSHLTGDNAINAGRDVLRGVPVSKLTEEQLAIYVTEKLVRPTDPSLIERVPPLSASSLVATLTPDEVAAVGGRMPRPEENYTLEIFRPVLPPGLIGGSGISPLIISPGSVTALGNLFVIDLPIIGARGEDGENSAQAGGAGGTGLRLFPGISGNYELRFTTASDIIGGMGGNGASDLSTMAGDGGIGLDARRVKFLKMVVQSGPPADYANLPQTVAGETISISGGAPGYRSASPGRNGLDLLLADGGTIILESAQRLGAVTNDVDYHLDLGTIHARNITIDGTAFKGGIIATTLSGSNRIIGGNLADRLAGGDGNDIIDGGPAVDNITGGDGNDRIIYSGGGGDDRLDGGAGEDTLVVKGTFSTNIAVDFRDVAPNGDQLGIDGFISGEVQKGFEHADLSSLSADHYLAAMINGNAEDNSLSGGKGRDEISGGAGNDHLFGHDGADILIGGPGRDIIDGGAGADTIITRVGDAGTNISNNPDYDTITDLEPVDTLNFGVTPMLVGVGSAASRPDYTVSIDQNRFIAFALDIDNLQSKINAIKSDARFDQPNMLGQFIDGAYIYIYHSGALGDGSGVADNNSDDMLIQIQYISAQSDIVSHIDFSNEIAPPVPTEPPVAPPIPAEPLVEPPVPTEPLIEPPVPTEPLIEPPAPPIPTEPLIEPPVPTEPLVEPPAPPIPTEPLIEPPVAPPVPTEPLIEPPAPPIPTEPLIEPPAPPIPAELFVEPPLNSPPSQTPRVIINGTDGADRPLNGTMGNDEISGFAGDDIIDGKGGQDLISGGDGNDVFILAPVKEGGITITDFTPGADRLHIHLNDTSASESNHNWIRADEGNSDISQGDIAVIQNIEEGGFDLNAARAGTNILRISDKAAVSHAELAAGLESGGAYELTSNSPLSVNDALLILYCDGVDTFFAKAVIGAEIAEDSPLAPSSLSITNMVTLKATGLNELNQLPFDAFYFVA